MRNQHAGDVVPGAGALDRMAGGLSGGPAQPAPGWRRRAALGLGVAIVAILVWSVLFLAGAPGSFAMLVASLLSGLAATLASQPVTPSPPASVEPALPAESLRRLRHDLRGILSPALMTADRLLMTTQDPVAKRAAETMVETIERAEKRLAG